MKKIYASLILLMFVSWANAQLYPVGIESKIAEADIIVEGTVVEQSSFWNESHSMIFTNNKIKLHKVFKGQNVADFIEVLTMGGTVGTDYITVSELLELRKNEEGIFFCHPNSINLRSPQTGALLYDIASSAQGFLRYDKLKNIADAPFCKYAGISTLLYNELQQKVGRSFTNVDANYNVDNVITPEATPVITSMSPLTIYAGAFYNTAANVLTITGTGFGTPTGTAAILFDDANNGNGGTTLDIAATDNTIISWTDTEIRVRVHSRVGSGTIQVRNADPATSAASPQSLNVIYSILNATFQIPGGTGPLYTKEGNLIGTNGLGGYTIQYSTSTAGSGIDFTTSEAMAPFQRALNTWKQNGGFNITEGGNTTSQTLGGTESIIMYDNANNGSAPMANGVLAYCTGNFSMCGNDPAGNKAFRTRFNIVLRTPGYSTGTATFSAGPCPPNSSDFNALDLETVLLHELGHAANLGHINDSWQNNQVGRINPAKLMNFAIIPSTKRTSLDYAALYGLNYVLSPKGNVYGNCIGNTDMVALTKTTVANDECPLSFPTTTIASGTTVNFDLVNATSNRYVDPAYTQIRCDGIGTQVTNNAYYAFKAMNAGSLTLSVSNYSTTPAALASCTSPYAGVEVTGVRAALYAVSSCPTAGSFPAPIWCGTITGNAILPVVNGIAANTSYLLLVNGIDNTKASFDITFVGTVLPVKLSAFNGKVLKDANQLDWSVQAMDNVLKMELEKSADGTNFASLTTFSGEALNKTSNSYKDYAPLMGNNYYRLKTTNNDGSIEYSNIVLLKRNDKFLITLSPNPAKNFINVSISSKEKEVYTFKLINGVGQVLINKQLNILPGNQLFPIAISGIAKGAYYTLISNNVGEKLKTQTLIIQ